MCGFLGKALRSGAEKADNALHTAVDAGSDAAKKAIETGKNVKDGTQRAAVGTREVEKLERLAKLWREGALTDEEFESAKADILGRL